MSQRKPPMSSGPGTRNHRPEHKRNLSATVEKEAKLRHPSIPSIPSIPDSIQARGKLLEKDPC